jgi:hypothetical protein
MRKLRELTASSLVEFTLMYLPSSAVIATLKSTKEYRDYQRFAKWRHVEVALRRQ